MRLRILIRWVVILAVVGWAGYTLVAAGSNYLAMQEMVDTVLQEHDRRRRAAVAAGRASAPEEYADEVAASLRAAARRMALQTGEPTVTVSVQGSALRVMLRWAYPLVTYQGYAVVAIPFRLQRRVDAGG